MPICLSHLARELCYSSQVKLEVRLGIKVHSRSDVELEVAIRTLIIVDRHEVALIEEAVMTCARICFYHEQTGPPGWIQTRHVLCLLDPLHVRQHLQRKSLQTQERNRSYGKDQRIHIRSGYLSSLNIYMLGFLT